MAIDLSKPPEDIEEHEPTGPILERPDHEDDEDLPFEPTSQVQFEDDDFYEDGPQPEDDE